MKRLIGLKRRGIFVFKMNIFEEGINKATNHQILSHTCCEHCCFGKDCGDENGLLHCFFHDKAIEAYEVCADFQKKLENAARIH